MTENDDKNVFLKYARSFTWIGTDKTREKDGLHLFERENDYLAVTSKGKEFPLSYETADKVRDIMSGNMTMLDEYESKFFKRFGSDFIIEILAERSMLRHYKKEGIEIDPRYRIILDVMLNPNSLMSWSLGKNEGERKEKIERFIQDNFGVKVDASSQPFTNLLIKLSSDQSYERKKFLREALKKKKGE